MTSYLMSCVRAGGVYYCGNGQGYAITAITKICSFEIGAGRQIQLIPEVTSQSSCNTAYSLRMLTTQNAVQCWMSILHQS